MYCRYLFTKALLVLDWDELSLVTDDEQRLGLQNLNLDRNDTLMNSHEEHVLVQNGGNIDWQALMKLWSVLAYLTK